MNRSQKPHLAYADRRRQTFTRWPEEAPMEPEALVEAGFCYSGKYMCH